MAVAGSCEMKRRTVRLVRLLDGEGLGGDQAIKYVSLPRSDQRQVPIGVVGGGGLDKAG